MFRGSIGPIGKRITSGSGGRIVTEWRLGNRPRASGSHGRGKGSEIAKRQRFDACAIGSRRRYSNKQITGLEHRAICASSSRSSTDSRTGLSPSHRAPRSLGPIRYSAAKTAALRLYVEMCSLSRAVAVQSTCATTRDGEVVMNIGCARRALPNGANERSNVVLKLDEYQDRVVSTKDAGSIGMVSIMAQRQKKKGVTVWREGRDAKQQTPFSARIRQ